MNKKELVKWGSKTAKGGFKNEKDVIGRFNNWEKDEIAKEWLRAMNYSIEDIESVKAIKITGHYKADIQVAVRIIIKLKSQEDLQNIQVKLVGSGNFNQIDKRWTDKYVEMWKIPTDVVKILKLFTGEVKSIQRGLRDSRKVFFSEMNEGDKNKVLDFFKNNKILIVSDLLKGRGEFSADWFLVILKSATKSKWVLKSINEAMNVFGSGDVKITKKGNLVIGKISMQRKGGDSGRETAKMLQFKIKPLMLFI